MKGYPLLVLTFLGWISVPSLNAQQTQLLHQGDRILFVGNSKVGSEGGLHNHFRRTLGRADDPMTIGCSWISMYGQTTLSDMYTGELVDSITSGRSDIVIVSSGSETAMDSFARLITDRGKTMVLYATWADNPFLPPGTWSRFEADTRKTADHTRKFGDDHKVPIIPAGLIYYDLLAKPPAWKGLRPDFLFVPGSSVQNDLGTLVNVSATYAVLTGKSPVGLPMWDVFPEDLVTAIQHRVWEVLQMWKTGEYQLPDAPTPDKQIPVRMPAADPLWKGTLESGMSLYYVGNSFIGTEGGLENHFPRLLTEIEPSIEIETSSDIFWGRGLSHMHTEKVRKKIGSGENEIVLVTSGPVEWLDKFRQDIDAVGSSMFVHMTWGRNPTINDGGIHAFYEQTVKIAQGMKKFETDTGVDVIPCGLIFYDLIVDPPEIKGLREDWVFMVENIHQNHLGTMVNAAAHYAVLTGKSPVGLPMWDPYPPQLVEAIQQRTWQIVQAWKADRLNIKEPG